MTGKQGDYPTPGLYPGYGRAARLVALLGLRASASGSGACRIVRMFAAAVRILWLVIRGCEGAAVAVKQV